MENIDHTRTKAKSPQTNGICERFHKTVLDEFYRVAFRKRVYQTIDALQADLDGWMQEYNAVRSHQGRWCYGKTPSRPSSTPSRWPAKRCYKQGDTGHTYPSDTHRDGTLSVRSSPYFYR